MAADATYAAGSNYSVQGGLTWVIGGNLNVVTGGKMLAEGTQAANIPSITDNTSGSASSTLSVVGATNGGDVSGAINNGFATISAKLNALLLACKNLGIHAA